MKNLFVLIISGNIDVKEISRLRHGIAKIEWFVVFVKNRKMGDKVKVKVIQVGNRFTTARVV